jgi:hypothetical protein
MNIKTLTIIIAVSALVSGTVSYLMAGKSFAGTSNVKQELTKLIQKTTQK